MGSYLEILKLVITLIPALIELIKAVEAAFPGSGNGPQKLAIVRDTLQKTFEQTGNVKITFDQLWPVLHTMINSIVKAFNATGIFKKDAPVAK